MSDSPKEFQEEFNDDALELPLIKSAMLDSSFQFPDLTQAVMAQYAQDLSDSPPCQYDFEFLSTYFDNQLHLEIADQTLLKLRIEAFEKHLPQCPLCNDQLGLLLEVCESYRNHVYHLERGLESLDLTNRVMAAYQQSLLEDQILDESVPIPAVGCGQLTAEQLCAHMDNELEASERHHMQNHLESCAPCGEALLQLTTAHRNMGLFYERELEQTVPPLALWPVIQEKLLQEQLQRSNVVPLAKGKKPWIAVATTAAAVLLLVFFFPLGTPLMQQTLVFQPAAEPPVGAPEINTVALEEAIRADMQDTMAKQRGIIEIKEDYAVPVIYQTPEAYLFSEESELLTEEDWPEELDVSAFVLYE